MLHILKYVLICSELLYVCYNLFSYKMYSWNGLVKGIGKLEDYTRQDTELSNAMNHLL